MVLTLTPCLLNNQQHVTWTHPCIYCRSTYQCLWVRLCAWIHARACVFWKDGAENSERPDQVKWYCPQQSLYIVTQTDLQDECSVFWLNTQMTLPCKKRGTAKDKIVMELFLFFSILFFYFFYLVYLVYKLWTNCHGMVQGLFIGGLVCMVKKINDQS